MTKQEFINKYYPWAERINKEYGLKFSPYFWIAQWSLESNVGTNLWTTRDNNVSASNVTNGANTPIVKSGRYQNSFATLEDWYKNLTVNILNLGGNSTYRKAGFNNATTIAEAARAIVAGGYTATDRDTYAQNIVNIANDYMKNTKLPTGYTIPVSDKSDTGKTSNSTSSGKTSNSDTGSGSENNDTVKIIETDEDSDFISFKDLEKYLTVKNILLYFIALTLVLVVIKYLNKRKELKL